MQSVLTVSADKELFGRIKGLLVSLYPDIDIRLALCCSDGCDAVLAAEYDLVVIDGSMSSAAEGLALKAVRKTSAGCILLTGAEQADALADKLEDMGVLVLPKSADAALLRRAVKLIAASRSRIKGYVKENLKLHRRLDEIKAVNRAKLVLMQYLKFSEEQAHRYIEKQAMDLRMTRYEIAMKIIKTYDLDA